MGDMGLRINWMDSVDHAIEVIKPDSWKGYTVGDPLQNACRTCRAPFYVFFC